MLKIPRHSLLFARPSKTLAALVFSLVAITLTGCGSDSLQESDPEGYAACDIANAGEGDGLEVSLAAGRRAANATTESIAATVGEPVDLSSTNMEDFVLANLDDLKAACEEAGYETRPAPG